MYPINQIGCPLRPCPPVFNPCPPEFNPCVPLPPVYNPCEIWFAESLPGFEEMFLLCGHRPTNEKIYVMYHGTYYEAAKKIIKHGFMQSEKGMLGKGIYVSRDLEKAMAYPLDIQYGKVVLKLRVNVGKVKRIDRQGHRMQKTWHDHGYDTAWVPPNCGVNPSGREEDCVWDPKRIKVVGIASANPPNVVHELEGLLQRHK